MTADAASASSSLPIARMAAAQAAAALVVGGLAAGAVYPFEVAAATAAVPAVAAIVLGIAAGAGVLALIPVRRETAGMTLLASGTARFGVAIAVAVWAWLAFGPHRLAFWMIFLLCGLAALVAEVATAVPALRRQAAGGHAGAANATEAA